MAVSRGRPGNRRPKRYRTAEPGEPYEIVSGEVPRAPATGFVLGAAICPDNHTVLVMGDTKGRPKLEAHMDDEQVDIVIEMLRKARASKAH